MGRYDNALERYSASLAGLAGVVPSALGAGKENAVAEDSRALAAGAMALEGSCRQLEGLRVQQGSGGLGSTMAAPKDGEGSCGVPVAACARLAWRGAWAAFLMLQ